MTVLQCRHVLALAAMSWVALPASAAADANDDLVRIGLTRVREVPLRVRESGAPGPAG